jgi:hypothetical protein
MSLSQLKSYFRTRVESIGTYKEHKDAFNWQNISEMGLNKAYHIQLQEASRASLSHPTLVEVNAPVTVRLFFKGYRDPAAGVDTAVVEADKLIKAACKASNRLGTTLKNVTFNSMSIEPLDETNDNSILTTLNFTASVYIDAEGA